MKRHKQNKSLLQPADKSQSSTLCQFCYFFLVSLLLKSKNLLETQLRADTKQYKVFLFSEFCLRFCSFNKLFISRVILIQHEFVFESKG